MNIKRMLEQMIIQAGSWIVSEDSDKAKLDFVPREKRLALVRSILEPVAHRYGMTYRDNSVWVSLAGPIRRMLRLGSCRQATSGELVWGVSFDFVPNPDKGWHRTFKSASEDISFSFRSPPIYKKNYLESISFIYGEDRAREALKLHVSACSSDMDAFYNRLTTAEAALEMLRELRAKEPHFYGYLFPFVLKETGRRAEAREALEAFLAQSHHTEISKRRLRQIIQS